MRHGGPPSLENIVCSIDRKLRSQTFSQYRVSNLQYQVSSILKNCDPFSVFLIEEQFVKKLPKKGRQKIPLKKGCQAICPPPPPPQTRSFLRSNIVSILYQMKKNKRIAQGWSPLLSSNFLCCWGRGVSFDSELCTWSIRPFFGKPNMVEWGIPEKIIQNAAQMC